MSLNMVVQNGRLPRFEGTYNKGEGNKKSFLSWCISVKRDFKPEGAQYYPEDLLKFKAFGAKADFIMNNFSQGDGLIITGKLQVEDDYTDKDGNTVKGQMIIMVDSASFADSKSGDSKPSTANNAPGANKPAGVPGTKPGMPGGVPGAKPGIPGGIPGNKPGIPGGKPSFGNRPAPFSK